MHTILKRQVYVLVDRIHVHRNKREGVTKGILHEQDRERLRHQQHWPGHNGDRLYTNGNRGVLIM